MQTQRDHVHAHQFMMGRLSSALVEGDPSNAQVPGRRALTGLTVGVLLAVLVIGGFGVYGWIVPGGSSVYKQDSVILVEKESGTRYVYLDGLLHPTANLTSAMLIQGDRAQVKLISKASLRDLPRGGTLGIAGAPQSVPTDALVAGPWLTCLPGSVVDDPGPGVGVNLDPRAVSVPLPADRFTVVRGQDDVVYLLAHGRRLRVTDDAVLVALGASTARVVRAPQMWLAWIPAGPALGPPDIPGAGEPGPVIGGRSYRVGTLFHQRAASGAEQLLVLRKDGLAAISRTEFMVAEAANDTSPVELDAAQLVDAPKSADRSLTNRLPDLTGLTWYDPGDLVLCLRQAPVSAQEVGSTLVYAARAQSGVDANGGVSTLVAPGSGMAVVPVPLQQRSEPQVSFISEEGTVYALAGDDSVRALKLDKAGLVPFPKSLLGALRQGPLLSREAIHGLATG
ncbi:type VII secretion protein EccB [Micromonospora sp. NPDC005367]|uniref:type VII secretion protein EccB n=1 Tax=Micromonospora sp. NPDC005367 TaxID=3155590 RepID=UPI0033A20F23